VSSLGADIFHIASPFDGYADNTVVGWSEIAHDGPARAATIYDLIAFDPEFGLENPVRRAWYERRLAP